MFSVKQLQFFKELLASIPIKLQVFYGNKQYKLYSNKNNKD